MVFRFINPKNRTQPSGNRHKCKHSERRKMKLVTEKGVVEIVALPKNQWTAGNILSGFSSFEFDAKDTKKMVSVFLDSGNRIQVNMTRWGSLYGEMCREWHIVD